MEERRKIGYFNYYNGILSNNDTIEWNYKWVT